jgi:hypothetical protein
LKSPSYPAARSQTLSMVELASQIKTPARAENIPLLFEALVVGYIIDVFGRCFAKPAHAKSESFQVPPRGYCTLGEAFEVLGRLFSDSGKAVLAIASLIMLIISTFIVDRLTTPVPSPAGLTGVQRKAKLKHSSSPEIDPLLLTWAKAETRANQAERLQKAKATTLRKVRLARFCAIGGGGVV